MGSCVFCKIVNRELPGHVIYEDDHVLAFLDISQATMGHTLVVPKEHVTDVFDMPSDVMARVFSVVPRVARALSKAFGFADLNVVNNNGAGASQTVFHFHVHLIPRYGDDDSFGLTFGNNMGEYSDEALAGLRDEILEFMEDE